MENNCLFCKIAEKEIKSEIIFENDNLIAFKDVNPQAPFHCLIIPRRHILSLNEIGSNDKSLLGEILLTAKEIAQKEKLSEKGYRIVNNMGEWGGQTVFHLHFHLLGKRMMKWPPG